LNAFIRNAWMHNESRKRVFDDSCSRLYFTPFADYKLYLSFPRRL